MDFERASIKALFYDYPVEAVVKAIDKSRNYKDDYLDILPQLVRWREDAFTTTEARLMENLSQDIWMHMDEKNAAQGYTDIPDTTNIPFIYRPFLLVRHMAEELLEQDAETLHPVVKFEELLRWKDVTLFLGEDLLTTAYIAQKDITTEHRRQTTVFDWPDYINHNNQELNDVLQKGMTDLHSHYNAAADIFNLNWITLTNSLSQLDKNIKKIAFNQDVTLSTADTNALYSYKRMCIAATFLRVQFFKALNGLYYTGKPQHGESYPLQCDNPWLKLKCAKAILEDDFTAERIKSEIKSEISVLRAQALCGSNGRVLDYAIMPGTDLSDKNKENAELVFHGERKLMYQFFHRFYAFDKQIWAAAPYFYLYLVLKTRIRKEFVQINQLKGFENFETYQDRKDLFIEEDAPIADLFDSIVLQTTMRYTNDRLEARITPGALKDMKKGSRLRAQIYAMGVFSKKQVIPAPKEHLSLVVHFIKANYSKAEKAHDLYLNNRQDYPRYAQYRTELKEYINIVLSAYAEQKKHPNNIQIVGIDAASTEMFCRPEVFGHIFRYARKKGLSHQTYHVGEDFFDIVDGLRAIDEAIMFLGLDSYCRIGHGLAMGIDAKQYYSKRRYRMIAPKQYVLDNCVWLCMTASKEDVEIPNSLETEMNRLARQLYKEIGYNNFLAFDMQTYWNSMLLRGDEPCKASEESGHDLWTKAHMTDWQQTAEVDNKMVNIARQDKDACRLYQLYHYDHPIKAEGEKRYQGTYPTSIAEVVDKLQEKMRRKVDAKQIAIETNPTSNLKIGFVDNYCDHPLLTKFDPIEEQNNPYYPLLKASVNTDDRGVFATTLYNELSLLALGMIKQKNPDTGEALYGTRQVMDYIDHLRQAAEQQRFK